LGKSSIMKFFDSASSKSSARYALYLSSITFFFAVILIPPILGIVLKWNTMAETLGNPSLISRATAAIYASFAVAIFVSIVDVVAGLPAAWLITRGGLRWLRGLDTLVDIPFIIPTATLGYSLLLFWNSPEGISSLFEGSLVSPGWLLVILLHFAFSYPVVVRVMVGAILDYKREYEEAARTLGAPPFTADRTVTLPILKPSLIASFTLAFARSISETGATLMVAGAFENGPILINNLRTAQEVGYEGALVFVSFILIVISSLIFVIIRLLGPRLKMPVKKVWPVAERKLSDLRVSRLRNGFSLIVFFLLVLIPSLFVAVPAVYAVMNGTLNKALAGVGSWHGYWQSLILSYSVGAIATVINTIVGLPMAVLIARRRVGKTFSSLLDVLVNIPLIVPSIALGVSLSIFWENFAAMPEIGLLVLVHLSITYPYLVRSMAAAIERLNVRFEEAGRTSGGRPLTVFRTITLPLTKYSLFAGAIMVFTRSVSETGATLAVTKLETAPVLLVKWVNILRDIVESPIPITSSDVGLGCGILIVFSFIILMVSRTFTQRKGRY